MSSQAAPVFNGSGEATSFKNISRETLPSSLQLQLLVEMAPCICRVNYSKSSDTLEGFSVFMLVIRSSV